MFLLRTRVQSILSANLHLRRKVDTSTLDLAVQEVSVRSEQCCCERKDTSKGLGPLARLGSVGSERLVGRVEARKDRVEEFAASVVLVVNFHLLFALGGVVVGLFADFRNGNVVLFVVVVLVLVSLCARHAFRVNEGCRRVRKFGFVQEFVYVGGMIDHGGAGFFGEHTKVNGVSILGAAVRSNEVFDSVIALLSSVCVVLVEFNVCCWLRRDAS